MFSILVALAITLCMGVGMLLRYVPFESIITPKKKRTLWIYYAVANAANLLILTVALRIWQDEAAFNYLRFGGLLYAAVLTAVNYFVIRGRVREHLFVFGVVVLCHYLLMSVPNYVVTFLPAGSDASVYLYTVISVYGAVLLLTYWPLRKLLCNTVVPILQMDSDECWDTVWFIPIALFATRFLSLGGEHDSGSIRQLIGSMMYIIVIIMICVSINADQERLREQKIMKQQLESQRIHYTELKVRVEEARKAKHDSKHHMAAIRHYIDMDDKEGLCSYCDELMGYSGEEIGIPYTGNVAADGVLFHYMQLARREQIDFRYCGAIHSQGIADIDLCVLLGNALDNAVAGCLTIPQGRSVTVISQTEEHLVSIVVCNTFDGEVKQSQAGLLSRKRENRCGVGLSSMRSVCERYGGSMDIQWDETSFTVMLMLPLEETK